MKTLVITGGSSGIGKATAELFAKNGYKVYELSRHGEGNGSITHITCDVTDPEMCKAAMAEIMRHPTPNTPLQLAGFHKAQRLKEHPTPNPSFTLISNAGFGISGAVEFTAAEDIQRQMDVNFMGAVNITQAALPYMRSLTSQSSPLTSCRIIFVSSIAGIFGIPFQAFYSASKFAVNGFAQALASEVRPFGIKVSVLMPGDVNSGFTSARKKEVEGADVYPRVVKAVEQMEHDEQNGISPERMAEKLLSLAESKSPAAHSTVGLMYKFFLLLGKIFPQRFITYVLGKMY